MSATSSTAKALNKEDKIKKNTQRRDAVQVFLSEILFTYRARRRDAHTAHVQTPKHRR